MVEMHVEGLSLDPQTRKPIVILRQNDGKGLLPLWIGAMEAMTISLVLNGEELPRPLAHDLLLMVARALNGTLTGVDIVDYRDDIYYAVLLLRGPAGLISVDCRPSDGIALALRASVPIRVKADVFEKAAREQEPGSIHPATRHQAGSDAATDMARIAEQDVASIFPKGLCYKRSELPVHEGISPPSCTHMQNSPNRLGFGLFFWTRPGDASAPCHQACCNLAWAMDMKSLMRLSWLASLLPGS